jgi:hypothetical protein
MKRFFEYLFLYPVGFGVTVMFALHDTFEGSDSFGCAFSRAWTDFKECMKDDK